MGFIVKPSEPSVFILLKLLTIHLTETHVSKYQSNLNWKSLNGKKCVASVQNILKCFNLCALWETFGEEENKILSLLQHVNLQSIQLSMRVKSFLDWKRVNNNRQN